MERRFRWNNLQWKGKQKWRNSSRNRDREIEVGSEDTRYSIYTRHFIAASVDSILRSAIFVNRISCINYQLINWFTIIIKYIVIFNNTRTE